MPVFKSLGIQISLKEEEISHTCNICGERLKPNSDWHVIQLRGGYQNGKSVFLSDMEEGEFVACSQCLSNWEKTWVHPMDRKFWMGPNPIPLTHNGENFLYLSGVLFRSSEEIEEYRWSSEEDEDPHNLGEVKLGIYTHRNYPTIFYEVMGKAYLRDEGLIIFRVVPGPLNQAYALPLSEWLSDMILVS